MNLQNRHLECLDVNLHEAGVPYLRPHPYRHPRHDPRHRRRHRGASSHVPVRRITVNG